MFTPSELSSALSFNFSSFLLIIISLIKRDSMRIIQIFSWHIFTRMQLIMLHAGVTSQLTHNSRSSLFSPHIDSTALSRISCYAISIWYLKLIQGINSCWLNYTKKIVVESLLKQTALLEWRFWTGGRWWVGENRAREEIRLYLLHNVRKFEDTSTNGWWAGMKSERMAELKC